MTAIDYAEIRTEADTAIDEAGQSGFILRDVAGTGGDWWNPSSQTGIPAPAEYAATFVITEFAERDVDGSLIKRTDKRALVSAEGLAITMKDTDRLKEADGTIWEIVSVSPLKPAGLVVMYDAQVRG